MSESAPTRTTTGTGGLKVVGPDAEESGLGATRRIPVGRIRAGFGVRNITPESDSADSGLRILGFWHERAKEYHDIRDPLYLRCAVFSDGSEAVCITALDLIGDAVGILDEISAAISETIGIAPDHILAACTHSHTTPETIGLSGFPVARGWIDSVVQKAVEAARDAMAHARSGAEQVLELVEVSVPGVSVNRRALRWEGGDGRELPDHMRCLDDRLRLAVFRDAKSGRASGVLLHFACHPVAVQTQPFLSADYPGLLVRALEEEWGIPVLFLNGAAGDINPVRKDGYADAMWTAGRLATAACRGVRSAVLSGSVGQGECDGTARLFGAMRAVEVARRLVPEAAELRKERSELETALSRASDTAERRRLGARLFQVREALEVDAMPQALAAVLRCLRVGRWGVVGLPGEPFCVFGRRLEAAGRAYGAHIWTVGYAGGYLGYLAPREAYDAGGYEVSVGRWSPLAPGAADRMIEECADLVKETFSSGLDRAGESGDEC